MRAVRIVAVPLVLIGAVSEALDGTTGSNIRESEEK
jgi:hypothetical protein